MHKWNESSSFLLRAISLIFKQAVRNEVQLISCNKFLILCFWTAFKWKISFLPPKHQYFSPYYILSRHQWIPISQGLILSYLTNLSILWFLVCVHHAHLLRIKRFRNDGPTIILKVTKTLWLAWMFWRVCFWPLKNK